MIFAGIFCCLVYSLAAVHCHVGAKLPINMGYVVQSRRLCRPLPVKNFVCNIDYEISTALSSHVIDRRGRVVEFRHRIYSNIFSRCPGCADSLKLLFCNQFFPKCLPHGLVDYHDKESEMARVLAACGSCRANVEQILNSSLQNVTSGIAKNPYAFQCEKETRKTFRPCGKSKLYQVASAFIPNENVKAMLREKYMEMRKQIPMRCRSMFRNLIVCPRVYCGADYESVMMRVASQDCIRLEKCVLRNNETGAEGVVKDIREVCKQYPDAESAEKRKILKVNGDGWTDEKETDD